MTGIDGRAPLWDVRLRRIARHIRPGERVLDLGAGAQSLRRMLPRDCRYTPADRTATLPDTLRFVMGDTGAIVPEGRWDVVVLAGVLEYAPDPAGVLRAIAPLAPRLLLSYAHGGSLGFRRRQDWANHLSRAALEELLEAAGYRHRPVSRWRAHLIYEART